MQVGPIQGQSYPVARGLAGRASASSSSGVQKLRPGRAGGACRRRRRRAAREPGGEATVDRVRRLLHHAAGLRLGVRDPDRARAARSASRRCRSRSTPSWRAPQVQVQSIYVGASAQVGRVGGHHAARAADQRRRGHALHAARPAAATAPASSPPPSTSGATRTWRPSTCRTASTPRCRGCPPR